MRVPDFYRLPDATDSAEDRYFTRERAEFIRMILRWDLQYSRNRFVAAIYQEPYHVCNLTNTS
jgi:hypothetical protein